MPWLDWRNWVALENCEFLSWKLAIFCNIFAIKHQNYKKNGMVMSRAAINWNCLSLPISYIIVVDEESKFYYISLYIYIIDA